MRNQRKLLHFENSQYSQNSHPFQNSRNFPWKVSKIPGNFPWKVSGILKKWEFWEYWEFSKCNCFLWFLIIYQFSCVLYHRKPTYLIIWSNLHDYRYGWGWGWGWKLFCSGHNIPIMQFSACQIYCLSKFIIKRGNFFFH